MNSLNFNVADSSRPSVKALPAPCRIAVRPFFLGLIFQALIATVLFDSVASADVFVPGVQAGRLQGSEAGAVLIGELNCIACHESLSPIGNQIRAKTGPNLDSIGLRTSPGWLRRYLSDPQSVKSGTTMPHLLHGLDEDVRKDAVENLVHFLSSLREGEKERPFAGSLSIVDRGRQLFHSVGCVVCHPPQESIMDLAKPLKSDLGLGPEPVSLSVSVPFGDLASKTTVHQLSLFLRDPLKTRPAGRMPSMNLTEQEATAIAMYLLRSQIPNSSKGEPQTLSGVRYEYYESSFGAEPVDFNKLTVVSTGSADGFVLNLPHREGEFGFRFTGSIRIAKAGRYTFFTDSDDGSELFIDSKMVVNNGGQHALAEQKGSVDLTAGEHPIMVTYFNSGGEFSLKVEYQGPDVRRKVIPSSVLSHKSSPMRPIGFESITLAESRVEKGRDLFASAGCAKCHLVTGVAPTGPKPKPIEELIDLRSGCLGSQPSMRAAKYNLAEEQRVAIRTCIERKGYLPGNRSSANQIRLGFSTLNCWACHSRDGVGGPAGDRIEYFRVEGGADLGDEGRIPPHLTRVGAKLREDWTREVLTRKGAVRPYMSTRMPQFGDAQVALFMSAFALADEASGPAELQDAPLLLAKHGRKLAGASGLSCIACHTFDGKKSLGIPAIDLTRMTSRLRFGWFRNYLLDPPSLRPGTRMPSFWPNGKSLKPEILDGDTETQIRSLWIYLKDARTVGLPDGLVQGKHELIPVKEPVIYRNFITGAGSRAIGVGYPEKVNLAFDANEVRLGLLWQGSFIDASRHMTGRGEGFEPPLGHNVYSMPKGPVFAELESPAQDWPPPPPRNADLRFMGYELDASRRPRFLYRYKSWVVEESLVPVEGKVDVGFVRKLVVTGKTSETQLWFRAGSGKAILPQEGNSFLVDGRVLLKIGTTSSKPVVRGVSGLKMELLVPVEFKDGKAVIEEEIQW